MENKKRLSLFLFLCIWGINLFAQNDQPIRAFFLQFDRPKEFSGGDYCVFRTEALFALKNKLRLPHLLKQPHYFEKTKNNTGEQISFSDIQLFNDSTVTFDVPVFQIIQ